MKNVTLILCILLCGCSQIWKDYPQDNIIEEIAEAALKDKTGIDVDFSPETPEK
jgi:hypothetical protein